MSETISVLVATDDNKKGVFSDILASPVSIPSDKLKSNIENFVTNIKNITRDLVKNESGLSLKELEVGVEITVEGGVSLIGTAKTGANAGLKLTFVFQE